MSDSDREPTITVYRDGPYVVRGAVRILDQDGRELPVHGRTVALCRCGRSSQRPFCDGTHKAVGFRAASACEASPGPQSGPQD